MSKPLTPGQEIAVLTSALGSTIRERDALRAENERLTKDNKNLTAINDAINKANVEIGQDWAKLKAAMDLVPDTNDYMGILLWHVDERDALRAENERLNAAIDDAVEALRILVNED